ncbi:fatty acyl-AMP ligase [Dactylosporangium sp. NPDC049525]|uniref:fatty acyl-AMP ligase n=1 Tax=Dactylosporangium sp. NPDC049525 TaxID=3154730 RepID=UPI003413658A
MSVDLRRTVGAAFMDRAAAHPDEIALTIYRGSAETEHPGLSYGELARRAGLRAEHLASRLAPGERVIISLPTGTEFVELYLACMLAGLVAVPAPPLGGSSVAAERVAVIVGDCTPGLVFATARDREAIGERLGAHGLAHVPVEEPGDAGTGDLPDASGLRLGLRSDALAVLQYSSGSTGSPKGVLLDHGNVLANVLSLHVNGGIGRPGDSFGTWMPLHHDFGLFAQLTVALLYGSHTVLMSPSEFVKRPVEWFRLMTRFRTSVTAAPNFAFDLCLRLVQDHHLDGLDLSNLQRLINGSEPIHVPTAAAFAKRFAVTGLRPEVFTPGYGMAESVVYVSSNPRGEAATVVVVDPRDVESAERPRLTRTTGGEGKEIVGVGTPGAHEVRIVDPATRRALPDGEIGELWLRGDSIGRGYWNQPALSEEIFRARLDGEPAEAPGWLRTGDLAALCGGELFITGRLKEMVKVRGRNLFPHDLEQQARQAHPALAAFVGAAFGVAAPDERVVLIHEVDPRTPEQDLPAVAADVVRHLTTVFGVPVRNVLLVRRGTVRRTTSGKIQRQAIREQFLAGRVPLLHSRLDPDVRRLLPVDAQ